jgi:hypothetical protein
MLGRHGEILAEVPFRAVVRAFHLHRETSQEDFVGGRTAATDYLSLSTDPLNRTTGASAGWGGGRGLAVMTTPCPPTAEACALDGGIALATIDLDESVPLGAVALTFLNHFDDSWDAEPLSLEQGRKPGPGSPPSDQHLQGPTAGVWPASFPGAQPGTFYPDGCHSQNLRSPAYDAAANLPASTLANPGRHAVLGYWIKPALPAEYVVSQPPPFPPLLVEGPDYSDFNCERADAGGGTQFLRLGRGCAPGGNNWGMALENSAAVGDIDDFRERQFWVQRESAYSTLLPGLRWLLVTASFDLDEPLYDEMDLKVLGVGPGALPPDPATGIPLQDGPGYALQLNQGLLEDLAQGGARFVIGAQYSTLHNSRHANQVVDEFAVCDFGDVPATALDASAAWADARYGIGRYYKGNDAAFTSARISPLPGGMTRLIRAGWTAYLPGAMRKEIPVASGTFSLPATGTDRQLDPTLSDARVDLELLDGAGAALLQPLTQGAFIGKALPDFSYRVRLRPTPTWTAAQRDSQPVLETPFFDDITFSWQAASGPRVLSWSRP